MKTTIDNTALSSLVNKIAKLRLRAVERGASEAEADTSARFLGRLLMENPQLEVVVSGTSGQRTRRKVEPEPEWVRIVDVIYLDDTEKAVKFSSRQCGEFWVPKSLIHWGMTKASVYGARGNLVVKCWFFEKDLAVRGLDWEAV